MALGDSYTIGTGVSPSDSWPNQLVAALDGKLPLQLVANLGVNGYSSAQLVRDELPALARLQPDFVSILIGVNDVVRGVPIDRYRQNVTLIFETVDALLQPDRVLVVSIPDYTLTPAGATYGGVEQREGIARFNEAMEAACADCGVAFVDISSIADQVERDPRLVASDGLHPSGLQYTGWVRLISVVVESLLVGSPRGQRA